MNSFQTKEYLAAAAACDEAGRYADLAAFVDEITNILPDARWEGGICGAHRDKLGLTLMSCADAPSARRALACLFGVPETQLHAHAPIGGRWIDLRWDLKAGKLASIRADAPEKLRVRRFSAGLFDEPVSSALRNFSGLAPIATVETSPGSSGWRLNLKKPLAWPLFFRADVAAAFAPQAAHWALLLRDVRLTALEFDEEALWARFVG